MLIVINIDPGDECLAADLPRERGASGRMSTAGGLVYCGPRAIEGLKRQAATTAKKLAKKAETDKKKEEQMAREYSISLLLNKLAIQADTKKFPTKKELQEFLKRYAQLCNVTKLKKSAKWEELLRSTESVISMIGRAPDNYMYLQQQQALHNVRTCLCMYN